MTAGLIVPDDDALRCRHCQRPIERCRGLYGNYMHSEDRDEGCPDGVQTAEPDIHACAVSLGRRGGRKGGKARAASLTAGQRSEAARNAAHKRWGTNPDAVRAPRAEVERTASVVPVPPSHRLAAFWRQGEGYQALCECGWTGQRDALHDHLAEAS